MIEIPEDMQNAIRCIARATPDVEICGILYQSSFIKLKNESKYPDRMFEIKRLPRLPHPIIAFVHSHPKNANGWPSSLDWKFAWTTGLPQVLYLYDEDIFVQYNAGCQSNELLGRPFRMGVTDCFSLVRDGLKLLFNIEISDYPRWWGYWDEEDLIGRYLYENKLTRRVHELQPGAVVVSKIGRATFANHLSLVLEDGSILDHRSHHAANSPHMFSRCIKNPGPLLDLAVGYYVA